MMEIPYFSKDDASAHDCAAVCLRMAAAFYGKHVESMDQLYDLIEPLGPSRYVLPWGICLGARSLDLHVTYISKQPFALNDGSRSRVADCAGLSVDEVARIEADQVPRCRGQDSGIRILEWRSRYAAVPQVMVFTEMAVVIPTLWQDESAQPHNVVLVDFTGDAVVYHDPQPGGANSRMAAAAFKSTWLDERTDCDLLLISDRPLSVG